MDYFLKEYNKLVGHKIVEIIPDYSESPECYYGLLLDNGDVAWILCDPEGNGPGFLDIRNTTNGKNNE